MEWEKTEMQMGNTIIKIILIKLFFVSIFFQVDAREVNIYIDQNLHLIKVLDKDTMYANNNVDGTYEYICRGKLHIYNIKGIDTNCVFISPFVSEYTMNGDICDVFLSIGGLINNNDCWCRQEDDSIPCFKNTDFQELYLRMYFHKDSFVCEIHCRVDMFEKVESNQKYLNKIIANYNEMDNEIGSSKGSVDYWIEEIETLIHNYQIFAMYCDKNIIKLDQLNGLSKRLRQARLESVNWWSEW